MVRKRGKKFVIVSHKTGKTIESGFTSRKAAEERLGQIRRAKYAKRG